MLAADPLSQWWPRSPTRALTGTVTVAVPNEHFEPHVAEAALESLIDQLCGRRWSSLGHTADSLGFAASVAARGDHGFASDVSRVGWDDGT